MIKIMNHFGLLLRMELIKLKRTPAWWLTVCGAALLPAIYFLGFLTHIKSVLAIAGNPWTYLFNKEWQTLSFLLLPLYIVLVTSLLMQVEYKANGWKHLLSQPVTKETVYLSKLCITVLTVIVCYVLFILFSLLAGMLLELLHPELAFFSYRPAYDVIAHTAVASFISTLGIIAFQFWLSLRFRNFILPVGIGIAGIIAGLLILNHWKYEDFYFYAQPVLTLIRRLKSPGNSMTGSTGWLAMGYFVLFSLAGYFDFRWKKAY